jgi:hypothetical protein
MTSLLFDVFISALTKSLSTETISSFSTTITSNKWLLANNEVNANLYTITSCIALADLMADGDYKLIIADFGFDSNKPKLKVQSIESNPCLKENI